MRGFSLLELMVALAVAAVLAAVAVPGYSELARRSLRQDARLALLRVQHHQERHFTQHLAYASSLEGHGAGALGLATRSDRGYYLLGLAADAQGYFATARVDPSGRQAADSRCAQLRIDQTGLRQVADASGAWRQDDPDRCWG